MYPSEGLPWPERIIIGLGGLSASVLGIGWLLTNADVEPSKSKDPTPAIQYETGTSYRWLLSSNHANESPEDEHEEEPEMEHTIDLEALQNHENAWSLFVEKN